MNTQERMKSVHILYSVFLVFLIHEVSSMRPADVAVPKITIMAYSVQGGAALLNCTHRERSGPVMWLHPTSSEPISSDNSVLETFASRLSIVGDPRVGQFNLLIRYTIFPDDQGEWSCVCFGGKTQKAELTILVPPVGEVPVVTPSFISVLDVRNDAWTFTCTSHFAHPPVNLSWVKLGGPEVEFDATPPSYLMSPDATVSVSSKLIVTSLNFGSVFACVALHPTFQGQARRKEVYFQENTPQALALVNQVAEEMVESMKPPSYTLDRYDLSMMAIITFVAGIVLVSGGCVMHHKSAWTIQFEGVGKAQIHNNNKSKAQNKTESTRTSKHLKRRCLCKMVTAFALAILLITTLCLAVPMYLKGITPSPRGVDELTSVVAGSALWLDCSSLATPIDSVLQLTWSKNYQRFYKQYYVNDKTIGFPNNSTLGYIVGTRVQPVTTGQISIWPMYPGEEGMYSCHALVIENDTGRTKIRQKTFGVYVIIGPMMNAPLLVLLAISIISALGLSALVFVHSSLYITKPSIDGSKMPPRSPRSDKPNGQLSRTNKDDFDNRKDTLQSNLQALSDEEASAALLGNTTIQNNQHDSSNDDSSIPLPGTFIVSSRNESPTNHKSSDAEPNSIDIQSGHSSNDVTTHACSDSGTQDAKNEKPC